MKTYTLGPRTAIGEASQGISIQNGDVQPCKFDRHEVDTNNTRDSWVLVVEPPIYDAFKAFFYSGADLSNKTLEPLFSSIQAAAFIYFMNTRK